MAQLNTMPPCVVEEILKLLSELREDIRTSVSIFASVAASSTDLATGLPVDAAITTNTAAASPVFVSSDNDQLVDELDRHECLHVEAATTITSEIHSKSNLYLSQHEINEVSIHCLPVNAASATTTTATTTADSIKFMAVIHDEIDALPPPPKAEAQLYANLTLVDSYIGLPCAAATTPVSDSSTNDYADTDDNVEALYNPVDAEDEVPLQPPQAPPGDPKPLSGLLHHKFEEGVADVVLDMLVLKADHCHNVLTSALPILLATSNAITNLAMDCRINVLAVPLAPPWRPQDARRNVTLKPLQLSNPPGSRKGVCTALAISNMSASVFGVLWRLEPLTLVLKAMWTREMEWLISMADYSIVELTPSIQELPDSGGQFEVMVSHPCRDLYTNLQALKKLLAMIDMHVERKLSKLYANVSLLSDVREMFDEMADQDCIPRKVLMDNCIKIGDIFGTVGIFRHMTTSGCRPNILTLACFLSVCTTQADLLSGVQHHSLTVNCEKEPELAHMTLLFSENFFCQLESLSKKLYSEATVAQYQAAMRLLGASQLINHTISDALSGLLLVEAIWHYTGWSFQYMSHVQWDPGIAAAYCANCTRRVNFHMSQQFEEKTFLFGVDENVVSSAPVLAFLLDEVVIKGWCKKAVNAVISDIGMISSSGLESDQHLHFNGTWLQSVDKHILLSIAGFSLESSQEAIQRKCGGVCGFAWLMGTQILQGTAMKIEFCSAPTIWPVFICYRMSLSIAEICKNFADICFQALVDSGTSFTGESLPITKGLGDGVYSGSTCKQGEIEVVVIATSVHTFFSMATHLVDSTNQVGHFQKHRTDQSGIDNLRVFLIGGILINMPISALPIDEMIEKAAEFAGVFQENKYEIVKHLQVRKHKCGMIGLYIVIEMTLRESKSSALAAKAQEETEWRLVHDSKFTQQELPACKLILTPKWVASVCFVVGVTFVPISVVSLPAYALDVEIIDRYDEQKEWQITLCQNLSAKRVEELPAVQCQSYFLNSYVPSK